jgi:anaerobic selenocysteine-containing dehydrogenase
LYDREFVEKWTSGFERLREHVSEYTLKRCSEITWLSEDEILSAASVFGQARPASIGAGMAGVCQANDAFDLTRALTILSAITGNLDVPGGNLRCIAPTHKRSCYGSAFDAYLNLPKEQAKKKLGIDKYPLMGFIPIPSPPQVVWPAVEEGKPYPVKLLGLFANNAVCAYPNSVRVKNVLGSLDFLFAVDYFHTPTTELADIVLPPAHWTERDDVEDLLMKNHVFCQQKAVEPVPECRDEKEILIGLARRINMEGFWSSTEEALNYRLKPAGIDLSRFKKTGRLSVPFTYRHYEKKGRFNTPSGKVELYADYLKAMGISPLPVFREPHESPVNSPDLYREYPLVLTTGGRNIAFYHSSHRNIPSLKKRYPDPELQIHPQTAADYGINDGEWVYLATPKGKVEIRVKFFEGIHPKVVHSPHGFWYGVEDGWKRLNINYVTNDEPLCPVTASVPIKALLCRIERRKI